MSRFMKAFVRVACLLAGLTLLAYLSLHVRPNRGTRDTQTASVLPDTHTDREEAADGDATTREEPVQPAGQKLNEPGTTELPSAASTSADPKELAVRPDENGMLIFSFHGQPWPAVFEWLADITETSLQWEEAPRGSFTYATRTPCTVGEARDKINSVLLSKGFTLLRRDRALIVAKLNGLDASLAPRVAIDELGKRDKHELVATSFHLDSMTAQVAAEEVKPLLSAYGKVAAMEKTNRLELFDTVQNLEQIVEFIEQEQAGPAQQKRVEEFRLRHARGAEVLQMLQALLGIEPASNQPADAQAIMAAQMLLQQAQGNGQTGPVATADKEEEPQIKLAVNLRTNSILANAPPDKMAMIRRAISVVDVPSYAGQNPLANLQRMQVYRVVGISPEVLVKLLKELGGLDPITHLEIDRENRTIIAFAPLADHSLIRSLIDKLDGAGRRFEVLQLRLLSAEYVAGSINLLMNGPQDGRADRDRYAFDYLYYFGDGGRSPQPGAAGRFQAEADIERNRLLLWANDVELAGVKTLLLKLGEIGAEEHNGLTTRMIPALPGEELDKLLERLQKLWPAVAPNPLDVRTDREDSADSPGARRKQRP